MILADLDWQTQALAGTVAWVGIGLAARKVIAEADRRRAERDNRSRRVRS